MDYTIEVWFMLISVVFLVSSFIRKNYEATMGWFCAFLWCLLEINYKGQFLDIKQSLELINGG